MNPYGGSAADQYLAQRISGASPEQLCVILLEGAERFLLQAIEATRRRSIGEKARLVNRVSAIVEELTVQLDHENGGELVSNLASLYEWWLHELFEGSQGNEPERLEKIHHQMGEIRVAWQELSRKRPSGASPREGLPSEMLG